MKVTLLLFSYLFFTTVSFAQSFSGPESVEFDAANNRYLVSNRGTTKSIQSAIPGQAPTLFSSNVGSPAGLEILDGKLWACDGARIKSYDLTTGTLIDNVNLGATFLNGITNDGVKFLFVSDFSAKKIYRFNTETLEFFEMVANTVSTPNGMLYDGANNRILFVNWGTNAPIKAVSLIDSTLSTVANTSLGNCDGIARDVSGNYFVSAWSQQSIYKFDNNLTNPVSVVTGLSNPADIVYNLTNDTLAVPNSQNNTVTYHSFSTVGLSTIPSSKNSIIAYPNPTRDELNISFTLEMPQDVALYVYNSTGQLVFQTKQHFDKVGNNEFTFTTADLPTGSYNYVLFRGGIAENGSVNVLR